MEERPDYFVFIYRRGPGWSSERPPLEQAGLPGHFQRMQELADAEILVTGGPFKDLSGAMGIIQAASLDHAREIVARDPVVAQETMLAEVLPWHPSVIGCVQARDWTPR